MPKKVKKLPASSLPISTHPRLVQSHNVGSLLIDDHVQTHPNRLLLRLLGVSPSSLFPHSRDGSTDAPADSRDSIHAARQLVDKERENLDYLVADYLAEVTMGLLARRSRGKDLKRARPGYSESEIPFTL